MHDAYYRSATSITSPAIVTNASVLQRTSAFGYDGVGYINGGYHEFIVAGAPGVDDMPGLWRMFITRDGTATPAEVFSIDSDGDVTSEAAVFSIIGDATDAQKAQLRIRELPASGSNYVGLQAPDTLGSNPVLTLPPDDGDANEFLQTDGSGLTTWEPIDVATDLTGILPLANGGTNKNMTAAAGGVVWTDADSQEVSAVGTTGMFLQSNNTAAPAFAKVDLTASSNVTVPASGVVTSNGTVLSSSTLLPMASGGTNKNMTASAGALAYSDADSLELNTPGTGSDWALSGGTGAPTFSSTTTTGKTIDGSADEVQHKVQANGTQTANLVEYEDSSANDLLTFAASTANLSLLRGAGPSGINMQRANTSLGSPSIVLNGENLGSLRWYGYSAAAAGYLHGAEIRGYVDGTWDSGGDTTDSPAGIEFFTTTDGAGAVSSKMFLTAAGVLNLSSGLKLKYAGDGSTTLDYHAVGSFTGQLTSGDGCTGTVTQTFTFERIGRSVVLCSGGDLTCTSNATTQPIISVSAGSISEITPGSDVDIQAAVLDNSLRFIAGLRVTSSGTLNVQSTLGKSATFTNSGTKGLNQGCWSYLIP
jgi:hypothetical protein